MKLKQTSLLSSGCQIFKYGDILYMDNERIIYAASLAVYILDASTYIVQKVLSINTKALSSIGICPGNKNLLVITSIDGSASIWDIEQEETLNNINMNRHTFANWYPFDQNIIGLVCNTPFIKLYEW